MIPGVIMNGRVWKRHSLQKCLSSIWREIASPEKLSQARENTHQLFFLPPHSMNNLANWFANNSANDFAETIVTYFFFHPPNPMTDIVCGCSYWYKCVCNLFPVTSFHWNYGMLYLSHLFFQQFVGSSVGIIHFRLISCLQLWLRTAL